MNHISKSILLFKRKTTKKRQQLPENITQNNIWGKLCGCQCIKPMDQNKNPELLISLTAEFKALSLCSDSKSPEISIRRIHYQRKKDKKLQK